MTKKIPLGGLWAEEIAGLNCQAQKKDGTWVLARPLPYYSFLVRLKHAWNVLRYKADAIYWSQDF